MSDFIVKAQSIAFWLGIAGALKLFLQAFGVGFITDSQVSDIANTLALVFTAVGIYVTHERKSSYIAPIVTVDPILIPKPEPEISTPNTESVNQAI